VESALVRFGYSVACVKKIGGAAPPRGRNMVFQTVDLGGYDLTA